jgi:phage tail-like protein
MDMPRPFAALHTLDQWARASHDNTALDVADAGGVTLAWIDEPLPAGTGGPPELAGGLAFDHACRGYHSLPATGQVERALSPWTDWEAMFDDVAAGPDASSAGFGPVAPPPGPLHEPRGLAVDLDDRLFIADAGATAVLVFDLWSRRLLRRAALPGAPVDLATHDRTTWALLAGGDGIATLTARRTGTVHPLAPLGDLAPGVSGVRLASAPADGALWLLAATPDASQAWVMRIGLDADGTFVVTGTPLAITSATDLEFDGDGILVVARAPGEPFRTFAATNAGEVEDVELLARGYDGGGIARDPDGRIAYWSSFGLRTASRARLHYERAGSVTSYRLDSGALQTQWGRVFIDACVPAQTTLRIRATTTDDADQPAAIARRPPANATVLELVAPDASPPMPPPWLDPEASDGPAFTLHARESGNEQPWLPASPEDAFTTYEAPIIAPPGRYLWLTLELSGDGRHTPRVRSLRAEHPGHVLLSRLPRVFSADPAQASFLWRYLAIADGLLDDLDTRSATRATLLDPAAARAEVLPWLAGFLGMVLDDRWSEAARRAVIAEAAWLFRFRGTIAGLGRFLELVLGRAVVIIERWRLRGLTGALGAEDAGAPDSDSVLGAGFRIGGSVGTTGEEPLSGDVGEALAASAHRFTVVIPQLLSSEQQGMVDQILEVHRPAHTVVDVCTAGAGMRVGRGLHLGLLSTIGRSGGFDTLELGASALGRGAVVGRPEPGLAIAAGHLGTDTRVG